MEFIITNREQSNRFKNLYEDWPEKLKHINSRLFKKKFNRIEYEKIQIHWEINKYLEPTTNNDLIPFSFPIDNDFVIPEVSIKSISKHLNSIKIINNEYIPEEGDELIIYSDYFYKEIKKLKRPFIGFNSIFLLYNNSEWKKGRYYIENDQTKFLMSGIIKI